jgi:hypothetical protein
MDHRLSLLQRHTNAGQMDLLDVETGKLDRLVEFVRSIANDEGRSVVDMINDARTVLAELEVDDGTRN